jgi:type I restriction enzyme S subunit
MAIRKWTKMPLKSLCSRIGDGLHGTPEYDETSEIFFINGNNLKNGRIEITPNTNKVTEADYIKGFINLNENSLLLSINGTLGSLAFYEGQKIMLGKSAAYLNFKSPINRFYYYYFQLKDVQQYFYNVATGSTIKNLSLKSIQDFEVPVPEENEWKKIASILSSLDTKIELNNRINSELEAMAKTLYDYWFVQFDFPNEHGKPYKSSGGKMVYNKELKREIPEGWEVESLANNCEIIDCLHSKKPDSYFEDEKCFLLQLENLRDDGLLDISKKYHIRKEDYKNWTQRIEVKDNDILITNAGRVAASVQVPKEIIAGIGRNITAIRPVSINPTFLFFSFRGVDLKRQIIKNTDTGSFFQSLNVRGIKNLFVLRPSPEIESKFENIVLPIRRKREQVIVENQHLASLRDWLLPMLMNGQVTVKEAEERVGEIVGIAEQSPPIAAEKEGEYKTRQI